MESRLRLSSAAEQDLREARRWYREHAPHVDERFRRSIGETLGRIERQPQLYAPVQREVRRAPVRQFPYSVFYRETGSVILVVAVLHQARDPSTWMSRGGPAGAADR